MTTTTPLLDTCYCWCRCANEIPNGDTLCGDCDEDNHRDPDYYVPDWLDA